MTRCQYVCHVSRVSLIRLIIVSTGDIMILMYYHLVVVILSPQIVSLAEEQVPLGVEGVSHLPQPAVTAPALQTVLVPVHVQSLG